MARTSIYVSSLVIASGQTVSSATTSGELDDGDGLLILAPDALTGVLTVQVGPNANGSFVALQSPPGTDVVVSQGKAIPLTEVPFDQIRVVSSLAEGAQRTIRVRKHVKN